MDDRTLLELAAKAAGITWMREYKNGPLIITDPFTRNWDPLTDDGDAFRLAVKLGFLVDCLSHCARPQPDSLGWFEESGSDTLAATRRAITRAAAAIGEGVG